MKQMITLISLVSVLALMSGACSDLNNPVGPDRIDTVTFPADAGGDQLRNAQPAAPTGLEAQRMGDVIRLSWCHSSLESGWFRVYSAQTDGRYELIHVSQACSYDDSATGDWTKRIYRVTFVSLEGAESEFSSPAVIYNGKGDDTQIDEVSDGDEWNL